MPGLRWTQDEEQYLINHYKNKTCQEIAECIGKTERSVQHKYSQLKLVRPQPEVGDELHRLTILEKFVLPVGKQNKTFVKAKCQCGSIVKKVLLSSIVQGNTKSCGCFQSDIQRERAIKRNFKHGKSKNNRLFNIWIYIKSACRDQTHSCYHSVGSKGIKVDPIWDEFNNFEKWAIDNGFTDNKTIKRYNIDQDFKPNNCYLIEKQYAKERLYHIWQGLFVRCYKKDFVQYCSYGGRGIKVVHEWHDYINFREWSLDNNYNQELTIDRIDNNWHYGPTNCRWATQQEQNESRHNNRQILAFGEVKSLLHWTRDDRCKASIEVVKQRLYAGWSTEDAISEPT